jgi:hypothetical protein
MKTKMLIVLLISLFLTTSIYANEKEVYDCTVDSVYKVSSARSVKTDGGTFLITVNDNDMVIESNASELEGAHNLKLDVKSDNQIVGINDTMLYTYRVSTNAFTLNTGIGPSSFNQSGGGHTGRQMRFAGLCTKS